MAAVGLVRFVGHVLARVRPRTAQARWLLAAIVFSWLEDAFGQETLAVLALALLAVTEFAAVTNPG